MHDPLEMAALGMFTGIVFIVGSLAVILVLVLASFRNKRVRAEMLHKERLLAIEKGLPVPIDYDVATRRRPYVRGMVWSGVGLGIMIFGVIEGRQDGDWDLVGLGAIALLVGVALLLGDWVNSRQQESRRGNGSSSYPGLPGSYEVPENRS